MNELNRYLQISETLPGWISGADAEELLRASYSLDENPTIVEIGSFFGRSTVLLAGPRCLRGSGKVHCVDPFDCSGDAFSVPHYQAILDRVGGGSLLDHFRGNLQRAGLSDWIAVHQGGASDIAVDWLLPIDLLLLDGDQSPRGAREAYDKWVPFLKPGGLLVLRNTKPRQYAAGHDGHRLLAVEEVIAPKYIDIRQIGATTFARKVADQSSCE